MLNYISRTLNNYKSHKLRNDDNSVYSFNHFIFNATKLLYTISSIFIVPFQKKFINVYSALLQANRLSFSALPISIKNVLIFFVSYELWVYFLIRIKNNRNLYYLRKNDFKFIHNSWVLHYKDNFEYYPELNSKCSLNLKISNFFYKTRIHSKKEKYKPIVFYFFNKIVFNKYPYFYWTCVSSFWKHFYSSDVSTNSQHVRTPLFFMFLKLSRFALIADISYVKNTMSTFKGAANIFTSDMSRLKFLSKEKLKKSVNLLGFENFQLYSYVTNLNKYKYSKTNSNYARTHLNIIMNSYRHFSSRLLLFTNNRAIKGFKKLPIMWYNKIHFTTHNVIKKTTVFYLRSSRHFNKGRYSRNRQLYRTGVYWCIWLNVVIVYGLYYYFYRVVFSFGYLWLPLNILMLSVFSSRLYKYRYYSISQLIVEFKEYNNFLYVIFFTARLHKLVSLVKILHKLKNFLSNYCFLLLLFIKNQLLEIKNKF